MKETFVKRSKENLLQEFEFQVQFLKDFCDQFDSGKIYYAKVISTILRNLLHDAEGRGNSVSVLTQLEIKNKILFANTAPELKPNHISLNPHLVAIEQNPTTGEVRYVPNLDDMGIYNLLPFESWWKMPIAMGRSKTYTRSKLVKSIADTDGGSHLDPALDREYVDLIEGITSGWKIILAGKEVGYVRSVHLVSVRQIAFEFLKSLEIYQTENNLI